MFDSIMGAAVIVLIIAVVAINPILVIWALNTLFGLNIQFTFWTWLAAFTLIVTFRASSSNK